MWASKLTVSSSAGSDAGGSTSAAGVARAETRRPGGPGVPQSQRGMGMFSGGRAVLWEFSTAMREPHSM